MRKVFIINLAVIILFIIFLELVSNFFKLSNIVGIQKELINDNDEVIYLRPNKKGLIFGEEVFTDSYGFRVPSKNFKYLYIKNIFILGDSVTFGNGIKEEYTFVGLLRKKFDNINFVNSSVPGYQMKDQINIIKKSKDFKNIKSILYFFTLNDVYSSSNIVDITSKKISNDTYNLTKIKLLDDLNKFLRNKSYLYLFLKGVGTDPSKRWFNALHANYENLDPNVIKDNFKFLNNFSKNIGTNFIVILLPYEYQTRNCNKNILKPQKMLIKILKDLNIDTKDLTDKFCNDKKSKKNFLKFDPMHLSKNGHTLVYNTILNEINF